MGYGDAIMRGSTCGGKQFYIYPFGDFVGMESVVCSCDAV
jgi:hypothetical protein